MTVLLTDEDLHQIKLLRDLASNPNNTYLQLQEGAFYDNALDPNPSNKAVQLVDSHGYDVISPPQLTNYSVNINAGYLSLNFDEPVDISTFTPTGLTLQASDTFTHMQQRLTLTGGTTPSSNGLLVKVDLTEYDHLAYNQ